MNLDKRLQRLREEAATGLAPVRVDPALKARTLARLGESGAPFGPSPASRSATHPPRPKRWVGLAAAGCATALVAAIALVGSLSAPEVTRQATPEKFSADAQPDAAPSTPQDRRAVEMAPLSALAGGPAATDEVTVYFARVDAAGELEMVGRTRQIDLAGATGPAGKIEDARAAAVRRAVDALLSGPTASERAAGLSSQIPPGTRLLRVRVEGDTAFLDFSPELERLGGTMAISGLLKQLTYTATGVPDVWQVVLSIDGERIGTGTRPFTGDGFLFDALRRE